MSTIRILIADDHQLFVDGLVSVLNDAEEVEILATASNGADAITMADAHPEADVLIMDLNMPKVDGIQATKLLKKSHERLKVLAVTQNADSGSISKALRAGVAGYLIKTSSKEEFVRAIRALAAGATYFNDDTKNALVASLNGTAPSVLGSNAGLSEREKEILMLIASEFTTNEIAARLYISPYTVETHRKNLIHKLGVRNTAGLVRCAIQQGLVPEL